MLFVEVHMICTCTATATADTRAVYVDYVGINFGRCGMSGDGGTTRASRYCHPTQQQLADQKADTGHA